MKIIPLVLALALLAPTTTWGDEKPGKQKGNPKASAPQRGRPAQAARPQKQRAARPQQRAARPQQRAARPQQRAARPQQRAARPQIDRAPRASVQPNRQVQRAPRASVQPPNAALRTPRNPGQQRPIVVAPGAVRAQRPVIAVREWRGAGTYGGRYWGERPRYQYNGSWFFYGFGPLPYYDNYDNFYPTYDPVYTGRIVTTTTRSSVSGDLASRAQSALAEKGFYRGQIDGQFGPASQRALRSYQQASGLPVTGELDAETTASLGI